MASLRFTRDKRGYETTALVHTDQLQGRPRQRLLYWFRTPPGVKVGRPALDAEAMRRIEEHNPDITFDWPAILAAQPSQAPPPEEARARRARPERRKPARRPASVVPAATATPEPGPPAQVVAELPQEAEPPFLYPLDEVQASRLRARYTELLARIAERGGDMERIESLRARAESLNPDAWGTEEDARKGLGEFETKMRDLRADLGLRRRPRRGSRGHRSILGPS